MLTDKGFQQNHIFMRLVVILFFYDGDGLGVIKIYTTEKHVN